MIAYQKAIEIAKNISKRFLIDVYIDYTGYYNEDRCCILVEEYTYYYNEGYINYICGIQENIKEYDISFSCISIARPIKEDMIKIEANYGN